MKYRPHILSMVERKMDSLIGEENKHCCLSVRVNVDDCPSKARKKLIDSKCL
jgi:hypothetical protein